jgi:hypothetical protein
VGTASRVVFVLLVGATFGAFFVAQNLKAEPSVVRAKGIARHFSPNGDGVRDVNGFSVITRKSDDVTVGIVDDDGDEVRRLVTARATRGFAPLKVTWDGRTDTRVRAPDGIYRVRIALRRQGRSVEVPIAMRLDTKPPRPRVTIAPKEVADGRRLVIGPVSRPVEVRVKGAGRRAVPHFRVWRTDLDTPRRVAEFDGRRRSRRGVWDGRADGKPAPPGTYLVEAQVPDRAGNLGSSAPGLPSRPTRVFGKAGITVRTIAVAPPLTPVRTEELATFFVDARGKPYSYRVRRLGSPSPRARGRSTRSKLVIRAPRGKSGVYLLEVRARRFATTVPFLVQSPARAKILVVLPAITWVGRDRVDDDGDGLVDTLEAGASVQLAGRTLSGLPADFAEQTAGLLVLLDRVRIPYDLTTDLALASSRDPRASDREGVVLAGPLRWVPRRLAKRLRTFVSDGGRLVSFGTDTLRRGVATGRGRLSRPTQPTPDDPFGARLAGVRRIGAASILESLPPTKPDDASLTAWSGQLTGFGVVEESETPRGDAAASVQVAIGEAVPQDELEAAEAEGRIPREAKPALTVARLGKGRVYRIGLPEWASKLRDPAVLQITRNILDELRRVNPKPRSPLR